MESQPAQVRLTSGPSTCTSCGRVIGVYEPILVATPWGHVVETSLAQRREIDPDDDCYHPACYPW
jgi:hypothetical protein